MITNDHKLIYAIAITTMIAPILHILSDLLELMNGGFSQIQLLINYAGFLPMPFVILGLYTIQRPRIGWLGAIGSLLYSIAFIYFTHTTLYALEESIPNYEILWQKLGYVYTWHGGLMVVGGILFAFDSLRAKILPRVAVLIFLVGIILNLSLTFLPLADIWQTLGSFVRNLGLIIIGFSLWGDRE
jgi:hypothetical protein